MKSSRRKVLVRAAAVVTGVAGLTFGSGAFTQVDVDRDFSVTLENDADAQLTIEPGDTNVASVTDGNVKLTLSGINTNATTRFIDALTVRNNNETDDPVFLYVPSIRDGDENPASENIQESVEIVASETTTDFPSTDISQPASADGQTGAQVIPGPNEEADNEVSLTIRILDSLSAISAGETADLSLPIVAKRVNAETISDVGTEDLPADSAWDEPGGDS